MVTIVDIAKKAGVSRGTVDRVLHNRGKVSPEKAERVKYYAKQMGYKPNLAAQGLAARKKQFQLGFCYLEGRTAPFFEKVCEEAQKCAQELTQYGVKVSFFPIPVEHNHDEERILEFARTYQMDGWVMYGTFGTHYLKAMEQLGQEVPPVVAYNLDMEQRIAFVGCDYVQSGRLACGLAALMTNQRATVGIITYYEKNVASQNRILGFQQEIESHYPDMKVAEILYLEWYMDQFDVFLQVKSLLERNPQIDTIYLANPGDYSICKAIYKVAEKRQVKIITHDLASQELIEMIKKGEIAATIGQEPEKQGREPLELLFNYLAYGKSPEKDWYKTELSIHIQQNVE
ncbi:MAG: LacI family DNA-binding transcriptional regulator [Lachnospiraceae bacterium]|uniref:LacI family DNA-binding transcriptional regulator n=1 Tax=Parablautia sp. Marseille-Q6255 TaxID=3039593 RepID=UPI0024BC1956|nr:LacI family DNA-binding transcriptional regulator [Parablautia sp. Marseille-Q6255]